MNGVTSRKRNHERVIVGFHNMEHPCLIWSIKSIISFPTVAPSFGHYQDDTVDTKKCL